MEKTEYNNADLNELFNFSYNFDLLKGIIETLLKNQQNLQKQVDSMKEDHQVIQLLKIELRTTKDELKKVSQKFQPTEEKNVDNDESSEFNIKVEKTKSDAEKSELGKIKTFEQLKQKLSEFKQDFEQAKYDLNEHKGDIDIINEKLNKLIEESDKVVYSPIDDRLDIIEKKLKLLLGDSTPEDVQDENKILEKKAAEEQKKVMNLQEMNRKISRLEYNKVESSVFDMRNDRIYTQIENLKNKLHELIFNLYGYTGDQYDVDKKIKFVIKNDFEKYKTATGLELERIWTEINRLKELFNALVEKTKNNCSLKDIESNNNFVFQKMEELLEGLNKKYVSKYDNSTQFKNLEEQFKRIILLLASKVEHENDNWLIAKKPINGYSCAACENFIGDLKEENNDKYINWRKLPVREREKEQEKEKEKEKIYRLGNGYSHVLKMVGVDNNKNILLNPNSNKDLKILFPGINENNYIKEGVDIQTIKGERVKSAHSKDSKDKTFEVIRSKNFERKFPKIKGLMSHEDFDEIIENPNKNINLKENVMSPKITKIMKKTHSKLNI